MDDGGIALVASAAVACTWIICWFGWHRNRPVVRQVVQPRPAYPHRFVGNYCEKCALWLLDNSFVNRPCPVPDSPDPELDHTPAVARTMDG